MKLPMFDIWHKRWMQIRGIKLHRVYAIDWADSDEIGGDGVTACGLMDELHMPGLFSRMGAPRCGVCCFAAGVPKGDGAPFNQGSDA